MTIQGRQFDRPVEGGTGSLVDRLLVEIRLIPEQESAIPMDAGPGVLGTTVLPTVAGRQIGQASVVELRTQGERA